MEFQEPPLFTASFKDNPWDIQGAFIHQESFELLEVPEYPVAFAFQDWIIAVKHREAIMAYMKQDS